MRNREPRKSEGSYLPFSLPPFPSSCPPDLFLKWWYSSFSLILWSCRQAGRQG